MEQAFARELAARRRDLEHEFQDKLREHNAQEKRRRDRLEQDRMDWESDRRERHKVLADREEKVRRNEESLRRDTSAARTLREELDRREARLDKERAGGQSQAQAAVANVESAAKARLDASQALLGWFSIVAMVGTGVTLVAILQGASSLATAAAGATIILAMLLDWRRRKLSRQPSATSETSA